MIAEPMDLGQVRKNLEQGLYQAEPGHAVLPGFQRDVRLIWTNAMQFNTPGSEYHKKAEKLLRVWLSANCVLHPRRTNGTSELYRRDISTSASQSGVSVAPVPS